MTEPIKSYPPTDEYRRNWEAVFNGRLVSADKDRHEMSWSIPTYKSGCPILHDGPQKDDL